MTTPNAKSAASHLSKVKGRLIGTLHEDAAAIVVHESVLEQILEYSEQDLQRELGGFLLGSVLELDRQCIEIRHFLPAVEARSKSASLTFTHDTWSALHREVDRRFPNEQVVGWQHTHPGFGIFLSAYDLFLHRHFFSEPWQVALVVDPKAQELGFYQWLKGQVVDCGFLCVDG